ncbi:CTP synthase [Streptomyces sp. V1I1]|nr:CTP synthase [Streptomyces sp. V1I1]
MGVPIRPCVAGSGHALSLIPWYPVDRWPSCVKQGPRNRSDGTPPNPLGGTPVRTSPRDHGSPLLAMPPKSMTTKHIFVTGGVASSLGKGLTASSLGALLKARGLRVTMQKLDPYLNVDPGTMNPFQHGEVFVTNDGAETDLDIGHYERFLDVDLDGSANVTTGQVYSTVIAKERRGEYLGDTVQVIPHITNEIKHRIRRMATDDVDVVITEVGGTVGDIESLPFLETVRQVRHEVGRDNVFVVHISLLPYIGPSGELKTKPTQHSVAALRNIGIQPDAIVLRADRDVPTAIKRKISLMCDVDEAAVVAAIDAKSIYDIPKVLHTEGLDAYVVRKLDLPFRDVDWTTWDDLLDRVHNPDHEVTVALVGKYIDLPDAYLSVTEALRAGGFANKARVKVKWVTSDDCKTPADAQKQLGDVDGILIPGGFGDRGVTGKVGAITFARENKIPLLGLCLGLQCIVIEAARNLAEIPEANSTEFDAATAHPVISTMEEQLAYVEGAGDLGGTMRLGLYPAKLAEGSIVREVYGDQPYVEERHRHRYEVNNAYRAELEKKAGILFSGTSPDNKLVEYVEYPRDVHPYLVATQAHPELRSRPTRPHPLFAGLVKAAVERKTGK